MKLHPSLSQTISKLLRGKATPSEIQQINEWYHQDEGEQLEIIDHQGRTRSQIERDLFKKIRSRTQPNRPGDKRGSWAWKIAASVILGMGLGLVTLQQLDVKEPKPSPEISFVTFENGTGMIKKIRLPDGSSVRLFHNTKIQVAENFSERRLLKLRGEAFFEVKRDSLRPFRVESGKLTTEVLGTSFLIKALSDESEVVAVKTGLVKVSDPHEATFLLHPNKRLDYVGQKGSVSETPAGDPLFAWTEDILAFQKTRMYEMVEILEDWYGVTITHNLTEQNTCEISGAYENQSLENLLQLIQYSIPLTYQLDAKNVILHFKNCP
jgi:ferric-dicitrate binding protein FerR (iron transport regulator)